jgi:dipeptidyl aminopeptidase/acylaminoacyl peptidase
MRLGKLIEGLVLNMTWRSIISAASFCLLIVATAPAMGPNSPVTKTGGSIKRPVTVADAIEMTKLGDLDLYWGSPFSDQLAHFSPDGTKVVVICRRGNLTLNTKDYSLLLWRTDELLHSRPPRTIVTMSSSSNRQGIKDVVWLSDSQTVAFLGERPGELQQVYTYNIRTEILKKITDHQTNVLAFSLIPRGKQLAYIAERPVYSFWDDQSRRQGFVVSTQQLSDLIRGETGGDSSGSDELFLQSRNRSSRQLNVSTKIDSLNPTVSLSPDGKFILVPTLAPEVRGLWKEYLDPEMQRLTSQKIRRGEYTNLKQCELITTATGKSKILLSAPLGPGALTVAWSPAGRSVVVNNTYLPLENTDEEERKARLSSTFSVEVRVLDGAFSKVSPRQSLVLLAWDSTTDLLHFADWKLAHENRAGSDIFFRKNGDSWEQVPPPISTDMRPKIVIEEDMNTPPKMYAINPSSSESVLLFDPNPQFDGLKFAKVEQIHWTGSDGHDVSGGLYYPLNFVLGQRYPLVIQTHGWMAEAFWIDGPFTTAFAAQPLAGKDIMVLQADEDYANTGTPDEIKRESSTLEGAIDYLDERRLIDRNRVGIIGFSRTCLFVKYALTHSPYRFAAASVTDGVDAGYFQYIASLNAFPALLQDSEGVNGGAPFGVVLKSWMDRSPGFSIRPDNVGAPLRITALNPLSILSEWEWFAALSRLGKPVEMIAISDADHILQRPWDRMVSQQGNVDWFSFWLKGEEDLDPQKAQQYTRWRKIREQAATIH